MPLREIGDDRVEDPEGKLIILCPQDKEEAIQKALTRYAGVYWRDGYIRLLSIPFPQYRDRQWVTAKIFEELNLSRTITHIIRYKGIRVDHDAIRGRAFLLDTPSSKKLEEDTLPSVLKSLNIDWLSFINAKISGRWRHGQLDRSRLERWLLQFRALGNHQWVGEKLLKLLDFWSDDRVREELRITLQGVNGFDCVSINRFLAGKSADALSNLIQKQLEASPSTHDSRVMDFRDAVDSESMKRILFIEDCLMTGNEMVRVLMALQGQEDTYGKPRAQRLRNPQFLRKKVIHLRFSVVSNGGLAFLTKYLTEQGLTNIHIDYSPDNVITTLTSEGLAALSNNSLYDNEGCLVNLERHVARPLFDLPHWRNREKRARAVDFCERIGIQLYQQYLKKEKKTWPERRVSECALGMRSFALALAFQHSVPKESLPLLWFGGLLHYDSSEVDWTPLFLNAA